MNEQSQVSSGQKRARILVVEDDPVVALSLRGQLGALGYELVGQTGSGAESIRLAEQLQPDLTLMDIQLDGDMDGVEAARVIRERLSLPVVYLTGLSHSQVIERAKVTEPYGYILKPCEARELHIVIEMALHRHQMERQLQERERLLMATLRSIGDGILSTDRQGRITFMNPVAERLTGWRLGEASGQPVDQVMRITHAISLQSLELPLFQAMNEQRDVPIPNNSLLAPRDRAPVPIDDMATPILDAQQRVVGGVMVFRDETAKRAAREAMSRLAAIVGSSEDAIIGISVDGSIASWNGGAERMFGYPAAEVQGKPVTLLSPPDGIAATRAVLEKLHRGESVSAYEAIRLHKNGQPVMVMVTVSSIRDDEGRSIGMAKILRNIGHLRQLEEQFRQSNKMESIGRLIGGVAHDFNNLLTVINGYSGMILSNMRFGDPQRELLEQVTRAGERAAALSHRLLAYSRQNLPQPKVVDLNEVLSGTIKLLRPIISEDIEFSVALAQEPLSIRVDPLQLEQVMLNLVINARDAMSQGGKLTLETSQTWLNRVHSGEVEILPGQYAVLAVRDTGIGMGADTLRRLFEPFFTTKPVGKGTGLGLATSYGIIKQFGGHIGVESRLGVGSTFRVYLPCFGEQQSGGSPNGGSRLPRGTETVLVVEDELSVRELVLRMLRNLGYTVLVAKSGPEALALPPEQMARVAIQVLDVVMPHMSGPAVAQQVVARWPQIKTLYLSGYSEEVLHCDPMAQEHAHFLQKPVTLEELARKVRQVLDDK